MRILVISNFYPPHHIGGYELGCRDVVEGLKARGHNVAVLTSDYGVETARHGDGVYRWLKTDSVLNPDAARLDFSHLLRKETGNKRVFKSLCNAFKPDLIYAWNMTHISISLIIAAQRRGIPVCYFVSDYWLSKWESDSWYSLKERRPRSLPRRLIWGPLRLCLGLAGALPRDSLDLSHVQFASRHLKEATAKTARPMTDAEVIYWGVDPCQFPFTRAPRDGRRLLYVGQITPHKGIHTAVEALKLIVERPGYESVKLTIVGGPDYGDRVRDMVSSLGLENNIHLAGLIAREDLPAVYREHDILIFPSSWDEPFSITLLEAMSSGLAVVGTRTGGSAEILEDEANALVFPREDANGCAEQVMRLLNGRELFERVRNEGRRIVERQFNFETMMDKIERALLRVTDGGERM